MDNDFIVDYCPDMEETWHIIGRDKKLLVVMHKQEIPIKQHERRTDTKYNLIADVLHFEKPFDYHYCRVVALCLDQQTSLSLRREEVRFGMGGV